MITSETPEQEELRYLASLLRIKSDTNTSSNTPSQPKTLNDDNIIERMDHHGVSMLVLKANCLSENVTKQLQSRKAMMAANSALKTNKLIKVFNRFNKAGLNKCVIFKGTALAHAYYPEPWLRPSTDTDCLIAPDDRLTFDNAFRKLKFKKLFAIEGELLSYQSNYVRILTGDLALNIDLHWRVNNRQILAQTYNLSELSERGTSAASLNDVVIIPSTVDSILLACIHRVGHHSNDERLIWLYDIHLLISRLDENEWEELCLLCEDKSLAAITRDALLTCQDLLGTDIAPQAEQTLKELARRKEPSKLFLQRQLSEWQIFKQDLKALKGFSLKLKLIREHVFPQSDYIREHIGTNNLAKAYLIRLWRGLKRIIKKPVS